MTCGRHMPALTTARRRRVSDVSACIVFTEAPGMGMPPGMGMGLPGMGMGMPPGMGMPGMPGMAGMPTGAQAPAAHVSSLLLGFTPHQIMSCVCIGLHVVGICRLMNGLNRLTNGMNRSLPTFLVLLMALVIN